MTGDNTLQTNWTATTDSSVVYLQTQLTSPSPFAETLDRPMDGIAYHAILKVRHLYQLSAFLWIDLCRETESHGKLQRLTLHEGGLLILRPSTIPSIQTSMQVDSQSPTFHLSRLLLTNRRPTHEALAIALDLGTIQSTSEPIVWAVGVMRDPVIQYTNASGQREERSAYYWANYTTIHDTVANSLTILSV